MRCVNIDWLEISCEEGNNVFPCNADYFRDKGYWVQEREYGSRVWGEMFTIEDEQGNPWIEVRRNPPSGKSEFTGLNQYSCRLRLVNAQCYVTDCIEKLRQFMLKHSYIFKRIYRIDIAYDFEFFDYGDQPARFARRYVNRKYRKINQCKLHAVAEDSWADFDWETLSWGSPTSMVSTKMYNKSKELATVSKEKIYIKMAWFNAGLVDDPLNFTKLNSRGEKYTPEIWRVEFSIKSKADRWLVIEDMSGKRMKKKAIPHTLSLFDSPDKLWQRFEDLAYHYFHFKVAVYKSKRKGLVASSLNEIYNDPDRMPVRKDLCPDKRLFKFSEDREFLHIDNCTPSRKPDNELAVLKRKLIIYKNSHCDEKAREACGILIQKLDDEELRRYTPRQLFSEVEALRRTLALRMKYPDVDIIETIARIQEDLFNDKMF